MPAGMTRHMTVMIPRDALSMLLTPPMDRLICRSHRPGMLKNYGAICLVIAGILAQFDGAGEEALSQLFGSL